MEVTAMTENSAEFFLLYREKLQYCNDVILVLMKKI